MSSFGLGGWTPPSTAGSNQEADPASLRRLFASKSTFSPSSSPSSAAATAADATEDNKGGGKPKLQRQQSWPDKYNEALGEDVGLFWGGLSW